MKSGVMQNGREKLVREVLAQLNHGPEFEVLRRLAYLSFDARPPLKQPRPMTRCERRYAGRAVRLARRLKGTPPQVVVSDYTHTTACMLRQRREESERRAYAAAWPRACKGCHGAGGATTTYDPSPAGVCLGAGFLHDFAPCSKCTEPAKGKPRCPRCGRSSRTMLDESKAPRCSLCGYADGCILPPQPDECDCAFRVDRSLAESFRGPGGHLFRSAFFRWPLGGTNPMFKHLSAFIKRFAPPSDPENVALRSPPPPFDTMDTPFSELLSPDRMNELLQMTAGLLTTHPAVLALESEVRTCCEFPIPASDGHGRSYCQNCNADLDDDPITESDD